MEIQEIPSNFTLPDNGQFEIVTLKKGVIHKANEAIPFRLTALVHNGKNRHQRRREAKQARKHIAFPVSDQALSEAA